MDFITVLVLHQSPSSFLSVLYYLLRPLYGYNFGSNRIESRCTKRTQSDMSSAHSAAWRNRLWCSRKCANYMPILSAVLYTVQQPSHWYLAAILAVWRKITYLQGKWKLYLLLGPGVAQQDIDDNVYKPAVSFLFRRLLQVKSGILWFKGCLRTHTRLASWKSAWANNHPFWPAIPRNWQEWHLPNRCRWLIEYKKGNAIAMACSISSVPNRLKDERLGNFTSVQLYGGRYLDGDVLPTGLNGEKKPPPRPCQPAYVGLGWRQSQCTSRSIRDVVHSSLDGHQLKNPFAVLSPLP